MENYSKCIDDSCNNEYTKFFYKIKQERDILASKILQIKDPFGSTKWRESKDKLWKQHVEKIIKIKEYKESDKCIKKICGDQIENMIKIIIQFIEKDGTKDKAKDLKEFNDLLKTKDFYSLRQALIRFQIKYKNFKP